MEIEEVSTDEFQTRTGQWRDRVAWTDLIIRLTAKGRPTVYVVSEKHFAILERRLAEPEGDKP